MFCRALLTAIAISYLICVLVLSGIQKEDLDVGLLTKLRQHNVNVDDLQSQKLRDECINQASTEDDKQLTEQNTERGDEKTEKLLGSTDIPDEAKPKELQRTSETNSLDHVLKYLKDKEKTPDDKQEPRKKNEITDTNEFDKNRDKGSITKISNILRRNTSKRPVAETSPPDFENFIKFWETYMKVNELNKKYYLAQSTKTTQEARTMPTLQSTPPNISSVISKTKHDDKREYSNSNEIEHISKMLADYIARKKNIPTEPETHLKGIENFNSNRVSQTINAYLENNHRNEKSSLNLFRNNKENDITDLENHNKNYSKLNEPMNFQNVYRSNERKNMQHNFMNRPATQFEKEPVANYDNGVSYKMVPIEENRPNANYIQRNEFENVSLKPFIEYIPKQYDYQTKPPENNMYQIKHVTSISPEILRRIADSVKEIVLKDIRKEMNTTTTTFTTTPKITTPTTTTILTTTTVSTTTSPPTTTTRLTTTTNLPTTSTFRTTISSSAVTTNDSKLTNTTEVTTPANVDMSKVQEATLEIAKFIQLFGQMKTMREHTVITPERQMKMTETIHAQGYPLPIPVMYPPRFPMINAYRTQNHSMQVPDSLFSHHGLLRNNLPMIIQTPNTVQSCDQLTACFSMQHNPIMIQTNQNEIPPLGIRLSKPEIINQNIILTTQLPFIKTKEDHDRWDFMLKYGKNPDTRSEIIDMQKRLASYSKTPPHRSPVMANTRMRQRNEFRNLPLKNTKSNTAYHNDRDNQSPKSQGFNNVKKSLFVDLSPRFDNQELIYSSNKKYPPNLNENNYESFRAKPNTNPVFEHLIKEFGSIKELEDIISRYKNTDVEMLNLNQRDVSRDPRLKYNMNEVGSPNRIDVQYLGDQFHDDPALKNSADDNRNFRERTKSVDSKINNYDFAHYKAPELADYDQESYKTSNIKGFHKRLETGRDWSAPNLSQRISDSPEVSVMVTPREQQSINRLKSKTRYDDSAFTNFLKVQEKVNNMLERILATKKGSEPGPASVEIL